MTKCAMSNVIRRISARAEHNYNVGGGGSIYVLSSKFHQRGAANGRELLTNILLTCQAVIIVN